MVQHDGFQFVNAWQSLSDEDAQQVRAFWERENALGADDAPERRVHQTVTRVLDADGTLAAVSTVVAWISPRLLQPVYYYRCFVGQRWRRDGLARQLLGHSFDQLEGWSREHAFPCIGVYLELENQALASTLQLAQWANTHFLFIGRNRRGMDLRVRYFRGARLKTPAEMATMVRQAKRVQRSGTD